MLHKKILNYRLFLLTGVIFFLVAIAFSPYHSLILYPLGADDASYLSHAFTLGLDFNLRYNNDVADWLTINGNSAAHPIGPGLLAAPFVALFSIIDYMTQHQVIENAMQYQYSWSKFGFVFSSSFYFLIGIFLYKKSLEKLQLSLSNHMLVLLCSSFGILFYVLFRPVMGHSYEFFSLSLCTYSSIYLLDKIFSRQAASLFASFTLALSFVLTILIRPSNINVFLLPLILMVLYAMHKEIQITDYKYPLISQGRKTLAWFILMYSFISLINLNLYGHIFPTTTAMYARDVSMMPAMSSLGEIISAVALLISRTPQLFVIIFTTEFGLIFSSPILILGLITLVFYLFHKAPNNMQLASLLALLFVYLGLPAATVLFWQSQGDAYGFRFLFCWFPISFIGYCLWANGVYNMLQYKVVRNMVVALSIIGLLSSSFYAINPKLQYKEDGVNAFGILGGNAIGYEKEVLKSIISPQDWLKLIATRFPGMMGTGILSVIDFDLSESQLPSTLKEKWLQWQAQNNRVPNSFYYQSIILYIFTSMGVCYLLQRPTIFYQLKHQGFYTEGKN